MSTAAVSEHLEVIRAVGRGADNLNLLVPVEKSVAAGGVPATRTPRSSG